MDCRCKVLAQENFQGYKLTLFRYTQNKNIPDTIMVAFGGKKYIHKYLGNLSKIYPIFKPVEDRFKIISVLSK